MHVYSGNHMLRNAWCFLTPAQQKQILHGIHVTGDRPRKRANRDNICLPRFSPIAFVYSFTWYPYNYMMDAFLRRYSYARVTVFQLRQKHSIHKLSHGAGKAYGIYKDGANMYSFFI